MVALYVTSLERGSGKTTVCAGLGKQLLNDGKKIGYFKPVIIDSNSPPIEGTDSDVTFMKRLFALEESSELLGPVLQDKGKLPGMIKEAYAKVAKGKDVVIIEGISEQIQPAPGVVEALDAKVIVIEGYRRDSLKAEGSYRDFGKYLLGIIFNKVPRNMIESVRDEISNHPDKNDLIFLGLLPEDRALLAPTTGELAEYVKGEILSGADKSAELVEKFMIGAMSVDSGLDYLKRKTSKAVLVKSERPDMQLAALETSTSCLVIAGTTAPKPTIVSRAEEKNIPIILAGDDISTIASNIENALAKTRFNQDNKLPKITEIIEQYLNLPMVYEGLGVTA